MLLYAMCFNVSLCATRYVLYKQYMLYGGGIGNCF